MLQLLTDIQSGYNMSELNSTSHQKHIFSEQNLQILQIFTFVCGISTIFMVYFVKKNMTGLHILIKSIFYFELGKNIISHIIGFICLHLMSFWKIQNSATCILTMCAYTLGYFGTTISISMISNIRLYLYVKQSLNETYQKKNIQFKILAIYVIGIGIFAYNIIFSALKGSVPSINHCAGIKPYPLTFNFLMDMGLINYFILMVFVGDIIMLVYRWRKIKEIVPAELVAPNSEYMTVPVHATLLSILLILIITLSRNHIFSALANEDIKHPNVDSYFLAIGIFLMVYSLIPSFIIYKAIKTKKFYPNASYELRRHDEKESQDNKQNHSEINSKIERNSNNENVNIMQGSDSKQLIKHQQHTEEDNTYSIQEEVEFYMIKGDVELYVMEEDKNNEPSLGQTTPNIMCDLTNEHMNKNMDVPEEMVDNFEDTKANNSNYPQEYVEQNIIVVDVHNECECFQFPTISNLTNKHMNKNMQHTAEDNTHSIQGEVEFNMFKEDFESNFIEEDVYNEPSLGQMTPNIISDLNKEHMNKNINDPQEMVDNFEDTKANNSNYLKKDVEQKIIVVDEYNEQNLKNATTKRVRDLTKIDINIAQEQNWDKIEVVPDSDE